MSMHILGIETSCDETSVAVVRDGVQVLSNVISTSRKTFERLAGVIPEQAARLQVECMIPVLGGALKEAGVTMKDIDAIAVTRGPGLLGSLLVGTVTARALGSIHKKPLIGVHHTLGHLSSTWLEQASSPKFPILTLSASGGHSDLWLRTSHTRGMLLGRTRDDAAGEAFDKGAALLGLPYPGGPSIEKASKEGNPRAFDFPLPLNKEETLDFSFSGLKTSLKYLLRDGAHGRNEAQPWKAALTDLAASYQHAICRHLTDRIGRALARYSEIREVHLVGGVSANGALRKMTAEVCAASPCDPAVRVPSTLGFCTDNAAMIAAAGYWLLIEQPRTAAVPFATMASISLQEAISR